MGPQTRWNDHLGTSPVSSAGPNVAENDQKILLKSVFIVTWEDFQCRPVSTWLYNNVFAWSCLSLWGQISAVCTPCGKTIGKYG